jgi:hypothetical protein
LVIKLKAILVAIIASLLVLLSLCAIVEANPTPPNYSGPSSPDTSLPKIAILLPENGTISNNSDISYSIVINKPFSWFNYGPWNGQIFSVAYSLDNNAEITIAEKEFDSQESLTSKEPISLQGTLSGLSNGTHTFQVLLYGVSYYGKGVPSNYYIRNNATANFSVDTILEATASPTLTSPMPTINTGAYNPPTEPIQPFAVLIVALVLIVIVVASLLLIRNHRKQVKKV